MADKPTGKEWVVVEQVNGNIQAEIFRGLLEALGIRALLSQEGAGRALGLDVPPLGTVSILVERNDLAEARQILEDYYAGKYADADTNSDLDPEGE